jgi:membrane-bound inhibitor of C-type lysozyme
MIKPFTWLLALAGTVSIVFAACSKDDDPQPADNSQIAGTWHFQKEVDSLFDKSNQLVSVDTTYAADLDLDNPSITFQQNGTVTSALSDTLTGTYTYKPASKTLEIVSSDGISQQLNVITLDGAQLVFESTDTDYGDGKYSKEYFYLTK